MRMVIFLFANIFLSCTAFANFNGMQTCIKDTCFNTRIADTPVSRSKGLMAETFLPKNEGMLFMFPTLGKPQFWMKNTRIPLDILFINDEDIIVYMVKHAQPCNNTVCPIYKTTREASKVLEINAGLSNEYGFHVGDLVEYFVVD